MEDQYLEKSGYVEKAAYVEETQYVENAEKVDVYTQNNTVKEMNIFLTIGDGTTSHIFRAGRRKRLFIAAMAVLIAGAIVFSVNYNREMSNEKLVEKYFEVAQLNFKDRHNSSVSENMGLYMHAIYCFHNNKCDKAISIFHELIKEDATFKESSMWYLAGCYLHSNESDEKITALLKEIVLLNGRYSALASEILEYKEKDKN